MTMTNGAGTVGWKTSLEATQATEVNFMLLALGKDLCGCQRSSLGRVIYEISILEHS